MKRHLENRPTAPRNLLFLALAAGLSMPLPALAASVALATSPLATSTTSTVKPNLVLVIDNSGSMDWDHMPDDTSDGGSAVTFSYGYYGLRSSQCNQVYYDPATTYLPPVYSDGTSYPASNFTNAEPNGFNTASANVDLRNNFMASQSMSGDSTGQPAYYFTYSGTQTTQLQKNYHDTSNTFSLECKSAVDTAPGKDVFDLVGVGLYSRLSISTGTSTTVSGITVSGQQIMSGGATGAAPSSLASAIATQINACGTAIAGACTVAGYHAKAAGSTLVIIAPSGSGVATLLPLITISAGSMTIGTTAFANSGPGNTDETTNFANWYSYYRDRMLMMKTATGRAFSSLNDSYRVGLMKISSSTPVLAMNTYEGAHRDAFYSSLYAMTTSGSTPLRTALSNAGRYYAGKLATDPVQYSCQQNFTILSTDGYWNAGDGYKIDGTTVMDNQDGTAGRAMYDGAQAGTTTTTTYTRNSYTATRTGLPGDSSCASGKKRLINQPQIQSCSVTTVGGVPGPETCTAWSNNGPRVYVPPYTSNTTTCSSSVTLPSPNPSTRVQSGTPVTSAGSSGGSSNSLADVAMYYYQTDLRTSTLGNCAGALGSDVCENNVFIGGNDNNTQQHMTTFTLGLGASGWMNYSPSYLNDTSGDFFNVKLGSTADSTATPPVCSWQTDGTVCNWPFPGMTGSDGLIANIDDLWHAAVNGRGAYFSATNPASLSAGLSNALAGINARKGAAAAAATSTLNPVAGNNFAYVASYTTVAWKGNLEARGINTDTGVVSENATWCVENVVAGTCASPGTIVADTSGDTTIYNCVTPDAVTCVGGTMVGTDCNIPVATACTGTMNAKVADISDTRIIKTANSTGTALVDFDAAYATANPANFASAHISSLSQWTSLTAAQQTAAEGVNLINFLRGQHGYEDRTTNALANRLYRFREAVMGDALESQPAFIGSPVFNYPYPGYNSFKTAQASRPGTVYIGANGGMMHAFASDTGIERWAYVPSMVIPNMWKLADTNYSTRHSNFVNGSPITTDVCTANCADAATAVWKTILVAGLNGGGRGYFALDITDPSSPSLLWEFTPASDSDIGYSFGQAVITRKNDGTWVVLVTSGYDNGTLSGDPLVNNSPAGSGIGYLYVLNAGTGAIISKISTGAGSIATPSGLAKVAGWNDEPAGNKAGYVYGGDLLGNVWRFDINSTTPAAIGTGSVMKFATLFSDAAGANPQPITTTPVLGNVNGKRVVFIGTGKYLETSDLTTIQKQTQYAIMDDNATGTLINPRNTLVQVTLFNNPDGSATRLSSGSTVSFTGRGWYADFPDSGERVNIDSNLVQGILLVPTIVPSNTVCSPGGFGWLNYFDYKTGSATSVKFDATIVGVNIIYVQGQPIVEVVTSTNPTPTQPSGQPPFHGSAASFSSHRSILRELIP